MKAKKCNSWAKDAWRKAALRWKLKNCARSQNPQKRFQTAGETCGTFNPRL